MACYLLTCWLVDSLTCFLNSVFFVTLWGVWLFGSCMDSNLIYLDCEKDYISFAEIWHSCGAERAAGVVFL